MRAIKERIERLSAAVDKVAAAIACVVIAALCVLIVVSVVSRWAFDSPLAWQYETTLVGFSWLIFIGMSMTFRHQEHMALTFITNALKRPLRVVWKNAIDIFCIVFLAIAFVSSISIVSSAWANFYMTIPVSRGIFYLPFPIGAAFSIVHLINHILNRNVDNVKTAADEDSLILGEEGQL